MASALLLARGRPAILMNGCVGDLVATRARRGHGVPTGAHGFARTRIEESPGTTGQGAS